MLLCCLLYPTCIYQVPLDVSPLHHRASPRLTICLGLSSTSHDPYSPHTGPILPQPLSHRSLDIIVSKYVLHYCLIHAHSHAGCPPREQHFDVASFKQRSPARRRNDVRLFLNSLSPSLPVSCKACVYSVFVSAPLCCLASMLLAVVGLALTSKQGLPISRPPPPPHPQHMLLFSPPSLPHNTAYSSSALPTTTAASMDSMDVAAASARYVVVLVWRLSTPFPSVIAPGGSLARLLASLLFHNAPRLPLGLIRCPV